jgi:hypothetical protein
MKRILVLMMFFIIIQVMMSEEYKISLRYNEVIIVPENIIKDNLWIKGFIYSQDYKIEKDYLVTKNINVVYYTNRIKGYFILKKYIFTFNIYFIIYFKNDRDVYIPYITAHPEYIKKEFTWDMEYIDEIRLTDYKAYYREQSIDFSRGGSTIPISVFCYPKWIPFYVYGKEININFSEKDVINSLAEKVNFSNKYEALSRDQIKAKYFDENGFLKEAYHAKIDDMPDLIFALLKKGYYVTTDDYTGCLVIE